LTVFGCIIYIIAWFIYNNRRGKMALSIRNPKAEKLARKLAAESGESL
jgi:hypothetical protein